MPPGRSTEAPRKEHRARLANPKRLPINQQPELPDYSGQLTKWPSNQLNKRSTTITTTIDNKHTTQIQSPYGARCRRTGVRCGLHTAQ